jgi:hypothetical protein
MAGMPMGGMPMNAASMQGMNMAGNGASPPAAPAPAAPAASNVTTKSQYYCPMHPSVTSTAPGACPICQMALKRR